MKTTDGEVKVWVWGTETPDTERAMKCNFYSGCKCEAAWVVKHLFGKRVERLACDKHKPGQAKRSEAVEKAMKSLPAFYECVPVVKS